MPVEIIHTYLVHPDKQRAGVPQIGGASVPLNGKLFDLLNQVYVKSETECSIDISFNHADDGQQNNECRTLILNYLRNVTIAEGQHLATRLAHNTDGRSNMGLLFLITGTEQNRQKIVISRFPAHQAILAEGDNRNFNVEFVERVFMKSSTTYKAAVYSDASLVTGFWTGRAIDKQVNVDASDYWIGGFLASGLRTTPAAGTRRLAAALKSAIQKANDVGVKSELSAAVTLGRNLNGQNMSINDFTQRFGFSNDATSAVNNEIKVPAVLGEHFAFDQAEFSRLLTYRSVELDSGAILTADAAAFEEVFNVEQIDDDDEKFRYTAEGKIVGQAIRKTK